MSPLTPPWSMSHGIGLHETFHWIFGESVAKVQRLAQQFLPLLFLGVTQEGLDSFLLFLADLPDLRPDLLRVAAFPGLLYQRLELFLELLCDFDELLSLLVGDFQFLRDLRVAEEGEQTVLLEHHLPQPFELFFLKKTLKERRQVLLGFLPVGVEFFLPFLRFLSNEPLK